MFESSFTDELFKLGGVGFMQGLQQSAGRLAAGKPIARRHYDANARKRGQMFAKTPAGGRGPLGTKRGGRHGAASRVLRDY